MIYHLVDVWHYDSQRNVFKMTIQSGSARLMQHHWSKRKVCEYYVIEGKGHIMMFRRQVIDSNGRAMSRSWHIRLSDQIVRKYRNKSSQSGY